MKRFKLTHIIGWNIIAHYGYLNRLLDLVVGMFQYSSQRWVFRVVEFHCPVINWAITRHATPAAVLLHHGLLDAFAVCPDRVRCSFINRRTSSEIGWALKYYGRGRTWEFELWFIFVGAGWCGSLLGLIVDYTVWKYHYFGSVMSVRVVVAK